jgi:hypothetical protein
MDDKKINFFYFFIRITNQGEMVFIYLFVQCNNFSK